MSGPEVTDADRRAAAPIAREIARLALEDFGASEARLNAALDKAEEIVLSGKSDHKPLLIAFAKHRHDSTAALVDMAQFLIDRIDEIDWSLAPEDFARQWDGHVDPPLCRLRNALRGEKS